MTTISLPSAAFGKGRTLPTATGGAPRGDEYRVLFRTDDFPAAAIGALEELAASVQWAGGGSADRYGDCLAIWPIDGGAGGALIGRLIDAGRDALSRPHALRIDAVYLAAEGDSAAGQIFRQTLIELTAATWPPEVWPGPPERIRLTRSRAPNLNSALFAGHSSLPRLLFAGHSACRAQGFDRIVPHA